MGDMVLDFCPRARGLDHSVRDGGRTFPSPLGMGAHPPGPLGHSCGGADGLSSCGSALCPRPTREGAAPAGFSAALGPFSLSVARPDFDAELNPEATTAQGPDQDSGSRTPGRSPPPRLPQRRGRFGVWGASPGGVGAEGLRGRRAASPHPPCASQKQAGGRLPPLVG